MNWRGAVKKSSGNRCGVTISEFECISHDGELLRSNDEGTQELKVRVVCSRELTFEPCRRPGKEARRGRSLAELRRTRAGGFKIEAAQTLEHLNELAESDLLEQALVTSNDVLTHFPALDLDADKVRRVLNGLNLPGEQTTWPWANQCVCVIRR